MQLGLLGLIAERGGFEGIEGVAGLLRILVAGAQGRAGSAMSRARSAAGAASTRPSSPTLAARNFLAAAERWLTGDEPFTAKLHPEYAPYGEYDQLMRLDEWYGREV